MLQNTEISCKASIKFQSVGNWSINKVEPVYQEGNKLKSWKLRFQNL